MWLIIFQVLVDTDIFPSHLDMFDLAVIIKQPVIHRTHFETLPDEPENIQDPFIAVSKQMEEPRDINVMGGGLYEDIGKSWNINDTTGQATEKQGDTLHDRVLDNNKCLKSEFAESRNSCLNANSQKILDIKFVGVEGGLSVDDYYQFEDFQIFEVFFESQLEQNPVEKHPQAPEFQSQFMGTVCIVQYYFSIRRVHILTRD
jgi:hypothetical protein